MYFIKVTEVRVLRWESFLNYPGGPKVLTRVLLRGRQKEGEGYVMTVVERDHVTVETNVAVMHFDDGGWGPRQKKKKNVGCAQKLKKQRNRLSRASRGNTALLTPRFLTP